MIYLKHSTERIDDWAHSQYVDCSCHSRLPWCVYVSAIEKKNIKEMSVKLFLWTEQDSTDESGTETL